jgi:hypothetical protein
MDPVKGMYNDNLKLNTVPFSTERRHRRRFVVIDQNSVTF